MKGNGSISIYKVRLAIKGDRQKERLDYFDTYSPTMRITSIRLVFAITCIRNPQVHQMDVKIAFLYGKLEEESYMDQPEGFVASRQINKVCKFVKSLYGLKQAPQQRYQKFDQAMLESGFSINESEKYIYVKNTTRGYVILFFYVDDMLIIWSDDNMISSTKHILRSKFNMKDMGLADVILGVKFMRTHDGMILSQTRYVEKLLEKFAKWDNNIPWTPFDTSQHISKNRYIHEYGLHYCRHPTVIEGYNDANWISDIKYSISTVVMCLHMEVRLYLGNRLNKRL